MKNRNPFADLDREIEDKYGLPSGYLSRTGQIESSNNPTAANPNSNARGRFQFMPGTAKAVGLADRMDPVASTDAAARLAVQNRGILRGALGRDPTGAELYLAHQQGPAGAVKLLRNPNGNAAKSNGGAEIALNGGHSGMSNADFAAQWINKFNGASGNVGSGSTGSTGIPRDAIAASAFSQGDSASRAGDAIRLALSGDDFSDTLRGDPADDDLNDPETLAAAIAEAIPAEDEFAKPITTAEADTGLPDWAFGVDMGPVEDAAPAPAASPEAKTSDLPEWAFGVDMGPVEVSEADRPADPSLGEIPMEKSALLKALEAAPVPEKDTGEVPWLPSIIPEKKNPTGYGFKEEMLNSGTFGLFDEMMAGALAPVEYAVENYGKDNPITLGEAYDRGLDRQRTAQKDYREENPLASTGAALAGGFLTGPVNAAAATGTKLVQAAKNIGTGVATGAAAGFGEAEGGLVNRLEGAAWGGGIGGAVGSIFPALGALARGGRAVTGGVDKNAAQIADDFATIGQEGTAGLVSGNKIAQYADRAAESIPLIGAKVNNRVDDAYDAFERYASDTIDSIGTGRTPQEIGAALQNAGKASQDVFRDRAARLYGKVDDQMNGATVSGSNSSRLLADLNDEATRMTSFAKLNRGAQHASAIERIGALNDDLANGMTYQQLADARSQIGAMQAKAFDVDPVEADYLGRIRTALNDDMEAATAAVGPQAEKAAKTANAYYRKYMNDQSPDNLKAALGPTIKAGALPETVFKMATSGTKDGGSKLAALRRQLFKTGQGDTWNDLSASVLKKMGERSEGDSVFFSADKFVTEFGKMSPEAKRALFVGTGDADYPENLQRVVRLANRFKAYGRTANHSNTENQGQLRRLIAPTGLIGGGFGVATGMVTAGNLAIAGGTAYGASRLLTYPPFIRWMAGAPKAQMQKGGIDAHLYRLGRLATEVTDPGIKNLIGQYLNEVKPEDRKAGR